MAANLHGYQRFTRGNDLVIELVPDSAFKALEALQAIGYKPSLPVKLTDFVDPTVREGRIRDKGTVVFQMCSEQSRLAGGAGRPQDLADVEALEKLERLLDSDEDAGR